MNFKKFLDNQIGRKDKIGQLAKRMKVRKETSFEGLYSYLYTNSATDEEMFALRAALQEYDETFVN